MKAFITILTVILTFSLSAQTINQNKLIGTWIAVQVEVLEMDMSQEQLQLMQTLKNGFLHSTYTFHSNGKFNIAFKDGVPEVMEELQFLNNTNWKFDQNNSHISIGNEEDNYSLMGFYILIEGNDIFFQIEESLFIMKMKKN